MAWTIDVVIPTYGGWPLTQRCLGHLAMQSVPHRVIVVDNASPDDTVARLRGEHPEVTILAGERNRGFGAACNRGAAAGAGDVVVFLNNDVYAQPRFLERLTEPLERPGVGSVAPVLLRPDRHTIDSVGLCADVTLAGFPRLQGLPSDRASAVRPELLGPTGAAAAFRRSALAAVGGFDEGIFLYSEDLDLALRLRAAGHGAAVALDAVAVHAGSGTAGRRSAWQRRHAGFSRGYLLRRYGVLGGAAGARALAVEALVVAGDAVISRDLAALRGRVDGWRAARGLPGRALPARGVDRGLSLRDAVRLRRRDYAIAAAG